MHNQFFLALLLSTFIIYEACFTNMCLISANNRRLANKKILLLENNPKQEYIPQEKYSNRVVAVNQQTRTLLSSIGAWKHIEAVRYSPVRKLQVASPLNSCFAILELIILLSKQVTLDWYVNTIKENALLSLISFDLDLDNLMLNNILI